MKAGYAALFGLVVAYTAYQNTGSSKPDYSKQESGTAHDPGRSAESARLGSLPAGAQLLPTITGGICQLTVNGERNAPCADCKAICPAKELSGLIEDYFRAESGSDRAYLVEHWNVPQAEQPNIKFVIASLPDPVHTHMALLFDRKIETIQSSAQANGYLFSRAWMPWNISTHVESADFTVRMAQAKFRDQVESLPGLMIFQGARPNNGSPATILFVFVVGETPTGGLRIEQFQNALNIRKSILADAKPDPDERRVLRIYGPEFSGSLLSLNAILNAQPHDQYWKIQIRSGTVSSYHAVHDFCESTFKEWSDPLAQSDHNGRPDFATFQFSDAYAEFYLGLFFKNREHLHSHLAILSEDETAFGNQEARNDSTEPNSAGCQTEPSPSDPQFVRLYFPREIAQLRDAYQRDVKSQMMADSSKNQPQTGLTLSLSVTGNDDDSIAPYSPVQTPLSQESILQGIVATLRKQHAKVVIIRATDPLDVIFLSRYLRQNYPQARLVTVGADLLMIHDFYDPRFHGILAVSPFPLLTGAEFPALEPETAGGKQEVVRLFPDSYSVGDFNAFQSLLTTTAETERETLPAADFTQFGIPSFLQSSDTDRESRLWRAHLWLAAVGREGYWPVALLDDVPPSALKGREKPQPSIRAAHVRLISPSPYAVHFSVGWTILWVTSLGLAILLAFLLLFPRAFSRSEILGRFGGQGSRARNCLLFMESVFLLGTQTLFVFPAVVWLGRFGRGSEWPPEGLWLVMVCYLVSIGFLGIACHKGFHVRRSPTLALAGVFLCGAAIIVTFAFTASMWSGKLGNNLGAFVYRYIHVGSGVSPFLPLLFLSAAWIWWCWQSLTGITSTDEKHIVLPDGSDFVEGSVPDASDRVRLKALAKQGEWPWKSLGTFPFGKKIATPALAGFLLILLIMRPTEIAEAVESPIYKWIYWILLYSCLLLVCYLVTHIVALWLEFRTLLRAIERARFRRGFGDLKSLTWKPLWKLAGNGRQEFVQLLGGEVEALTQIQNTGKPVGSLANAIKDVKDATDKVSAEYEKILDGKASAETADEVQQFFHELQDKLAKSASAALIYANEQWKLEGYAAPATKQDSARDSEAALEPPATDPTTRAVEHFLCLFYLNIVLVPLRRLQTLILAMAGVFVFVLISYSSYPFESRESFHVLLISIFFVISLVVGVVYGQMYTNPLLSRITNTKPGELGLDFWVRLGTFVFVPLLSLLSVQFPEINNFLFSWLQPALQSIK